MRASASAAKADSKADALETVPQAQTADPQPQGPLCLPKQASQTTAKLQHWHQAGLPQCDQQQTPFGSDTWLKQATQYKANASGPCAVGCWGGAGERRKRACGRRDGGKRSLIGAGLHASGRGQSGAVGPACQRGSARAQRRRAPGGGRRTDLLGA